MKPNAIEEPEGSRMRPTGFMAGATTIGRRIKNGLGGLMFAGLASVFVIFGVGMTAWSAWTVYTYQQTSARVTEVRGGTDADDEVTVTYHYWVDGNNFDGEVHADGDDATYAELREMRVGKDVLVWYDPGHPETSSFKVEATAIPLGFSLFALPFLVVGLYLLSSAFRGKPPGKSGRAGQEDSLPGGGRFLVFTGLCCVGSFALMFITQTLPFWAGLALFLGYGFVVIPLVMRRVGGIGRRREKSKPDEFGFVDETSGVEEESEPAESAMLPSSRRTLTGVVAFTVIWCVGVGAMVTFLVVRPLMRAAHAVNWGTTTGVVLLSKVKTHSDSDSTTFEPFVRYRYMVDGKEHISERYDFLGGSSSDSSYANRIVREHPIGSEVTVYYDPADPAQAVLWSDVPQSVWFLMLFLQPFVLAGLGMLTLCVMWPRWDTGVRRFLAEPVVVPWRIPTWGVLEQEMEGLTIRRGSRPSRTMVPFVFGYGVTAFISIFVLGFSVGFDGLNPDGLRNAVGVALGVGVLAALWTAVFSRRRSVVTIDPFKHTLTVDSRKRHEEVGFDEMKSWRIRRVRYPTGVKVNGRRDRFLVLEVLAKDGRLVPVHAFSGAGVGVMPGQMTEVVRRAQSGLAELTAGECCKTIVNDDDPDDDMTGLEGPARAVMAVSRVLSGRGRGRSYSDLA